MRRAIFEAVVGDDVMGEDPTVRELERRSAEVTGKEAALFVSSGTMSNLIAIMSQTERSDEVVVGHWAHILQYEVGGAAGVAGVQLRQVQNTADGRLDMPELESVMRGDNVHYPRTALVCIENTHNRCSGAAITADDTAAIADAARRHGARVHIDGARIFNAAIALDETVADLSAPADTIGFCLSKGLGAPVGSVLCGSGETIMRARKYRKMLGGGMRQAGIIAAAGVYALDHMIERLREDHQNAQMLARGLAELPNIELDPATIQTNIVIFAVRDDFIGFVRALKNEGVLCNVARAGHLRMVTHYGIEASDVEQVLERARHAAMAAA
jgi:threonine aldolase